MSIVSRRGACPALSAPMLTGDGLLVRLSPVAGGISPNALIGLARCARQHGNGIMEVTARGSLQIRGLSEHSARHLATDVDALGIAVRTGVPVETGPLAGLDPREVANPLPLATKIRAAINSLGITERLGPKVSIIVDGGGQITMDSVIADIRLVAASHESRVKWQLAIAGNASTAMPLGVVSEEDAPVTVISILKSIAELGREGRAIKIPRSKLPISLLEGDKSGSKEPARETHQFVQQHTSDPMPALSGILPLANGAFALAIALPFGSMPAETIINLTEQAITLGATDIRPAPHRCLLFTGLSTEAGQSLRRIATEMGFITEAADPRNHIAACPGTPACASGHIETRAIAQEISVASGDFLDGSFTLHVSGCAKGCAHPGTATLTIIGTERGCGLVVNGTARDMPEPAPRRRDMFPGFGNIVELVRTSRHTSETTAACLARLGSTTINAAFQRERA